MVQLYHCIMSHCSFIKNVPILSIKILTHKTKLQLPLSDGTLKCHLMVIRKKPTKDVFKICFNVTKDSAAQWFQYRILHRILPVKNYLKKIKATDNDDCTFCGNSTETIEHIIVICSNSLAMWNQFSIHIYNTTSERVGFNISNVILGNCPLLDTNMVVNFLILYGKLFIFYCSKQNKLSCLSGLLCYLKVKYEIEKCISYKSSEMKIFDKRWTVWKNIFQE